VTGVWRGASGSADLAHLAKVGQILTCDNNREICRKGSPKMRGEITGKIARMRLSSAQKHDLHTLLANRVSYIAEKCFRRPTVMAAIMGGDINVLPGTSLTAQEERDLFLYLNYARYKMDRLREKLLKNLRWSRKDALELLSWNQKQLNARAGITACNIGLVPAMAKRVSHYGVEYNDLVSEGNMALLRAVDRFDCSRGYKFSTYACHAIFKSFSRAARRSYRYRKIFSVQLEPAYEKDDHIDQQREERYQDHVREVRTIMRHNLADLSGIELSVVKNRFSLSKEFPEPLTLKQVGEKLDLSKERIRQIQKQALNKLREVAEQRMAAI